MNNIVLNKQQLEYIKKICDIVPKSSPKQTGIMIHFTKIDNEIVIYGGEDIRAQYSIIYNNIMLDNTISINSSSFLIEIKNSTEDKMEFIIDYNKLRIKHNTGYTDLNTITSQAALDIHPDSNIISINPSIISKMLKSIEIKIEKENGKFYIHIHNNIMRFIANGFGRMAITSSLTVSTSHNMFISCNYDSFKKITSMFGDIDVKLSFNKNNMILTYDKFQVSIGYKTEVIFNYAKYMNQENNYNQIILNTSEFTKVVKSFASINKSQRESLSLYSDNNLIICDCYNPNIGSKKSTINVIDGTLTRKITLNLLWLTEAVLTIKSTTFMLLYNNTITMPIILNSIENTHVIAPTIINV